MKTIIKLVLVFICIETSIAQEKNIETQSVSIDNLISFIVENYPSQSENGTKNITFLLQTSQFNTTVEDAVILKQAFKLLSKRLNEYDLISIITYSGINGIALQQTSPKDLKKILFVLDDLKSSVKEFHEDGIELAYNYAKEKFIEDAVNTVVMIRNPNALNNTITSATNIQATAKSKNKNNAILLTAIALLPEIISVIKD